MIFTTGEPGIISPKERNLYTKIFAGYLFNEIIKLPSINERLKFFLDIKPIYVNGTKNSESLSLKNIINIKLSDTIENGHVNFDNHLLSMDFKEEKNEYSDIGIWLPKDNGKNHLIAIEAKYTQNWSIDKDLNSNIKRIKKIIAQDKHYYNYHTDTATFILLITELKLNEQEKKSDSVLKLLEISIKPENINICIMTWEQIIESIISSDKINNVKVIEYFYNSSINEMRKQGRFRK